MYAKEWVKRFFFLSILAITIIGLINYYIDPLWTFTHANRFNRLQEGFNERQQKSNYIYFNKSHQFNAILLGSSRTTFINRKDFYNMEVYNYALNSMYPFEYKGYIDFFKKNRPNSLKYIIIGLDFYGSNIPPKIEELQIHKPQYYFDNLSTFLYRYKTLLLKDTLKKSFTNIKYSLSNYKKHSYNRDNIKFNIKVSEEERLKNYKKNLKRHVEVMSEKNYTYNKNYIKILQEIKRENPNSKFIIFTSPITADLLVSTIKDGDRFDDYKRWLKETISVFGEVNHFMTINSVTTNLQNYCDDDHYYPYIGKLIANKLSNRENRDTPNDFGILLNSHNVDKFLQEFQDKIKYYKVRM